MDAIAPALPPPGEIAPVKKDGRVAIPVSVLNGLTWWKRETVKVTAQLAQEGIVRIYPTTFAQPLVDDLVRTASDLPGALAAERLGAIADRYRELSLYSEARLRLTKEVTILLGFPLGVEATVFVQRFMDSVEILSMAMRNRRLLDHMDDPLDML